MPAVFLITGAGNTSMRPPSKDAVSPSRRCRSHRGVWRRRDCWRTSSSASSSSICRCIGWSGSLAGNGEDLAKAYERAINCIRHHLAIDSLTMGMLKEMGIGSESVTLKRFRSGVNPLTPVRRASG